MRHLLSTNQGDQISFERKEANVMSSLTEKPENEKGIFFTVFTVSAFAIK